MTGGLKKWLRGAAVRRAIAVVCAVAFVIVAAGHALHHFKSNSAQLSFEISVVDGGASLHAEQGSAEAGQNAVSDTGDCHGCSFFAVFDTDSVNGVSEASERITLVSLGIEPGCLFFENRPPILTI